MRFTLACSILAVVACGGAQKPSASEADTASLDTPGASPAAEAPPVAAPHAEAAPAAPPVTASAKADAPAPGAFHPTPGATGSIDGKPFSPKIAQIAGPLQKDGRLLLVLHEGSDCVAAAGGKTGDASMMLVVPWKDGYKVDLGSLRRAKAKDLGEAAFVRVGADGKNVVAATFKPTGMVTIVSAPTQKDAFGKLKIDLQSGDYILAGDLDVKVCVPPK